MDSAEYALGLQISQIGWNIDCTLSGVSKETGDEISQTHISINSLKPPIRREGY